MKSKEKNPPKMLLIDFFLLKNKWGCIENKSIL